jgi:hypothetical protein
LPPTIFSEAEAIQAVEQWVDMVQEKLTASPREWLEAVLRDYLQRGLIEILDVVEAANNGDEIADAALRRCYAETRERREQPSPTLEAYGIRAVQRGPVTRGRGAHTWFGNWRRDIGIAVLVYLTHRRFHVRPTRNREQRRRREPSAASIVAAALGRRQINVTEKRVEGVWTKLRGHIGAYLVAGIESSSIPAN